MTNLYIKIYKNVEGVLIKKMALSAQDKVGPSVHL